MNSSNQSAFRSTYTTSSIARGIFVLSCVALFSGAGTPNVVSYSQSNVSTDVKLQTQLENREGKGQVQSYNIEYSNNSVGNDGEGVSCTNILINHSIIRNLQVLDEISFLKEDWNGNGAQPFESKLIAKVKSVILGLYYQPEVFPTACDAIQIEYEKENGAYLEIMIYDENEGEMYTVNEFGEEKTAMIETSLDSINKVVKEFYG